MFLVCMTVYCRAQFKADYEALQARMYSLPDKLTHNVMVGVSMLYVVDEMDW